MLRTFFSAADFLTRFIRSETSSRERVRQSRASCFLTSLIPSRRKGRVHGFVLLSSILTIPLKLEVTIVLA